jgi:arylsulfate sulfotransferase
MNRGPLLVAMSLGIGFACVAGADEASPPAPVVIAQRPGATPFISFVTVSLADPSALREVHFAIVPKPGSVTRPVTATYTADYLSQRSYVDHLGGSITIPVFGLYASFVNHVSITYGFRDGSSRNETITIATGAFEGPCGLGNPEVLQARTSATLSYDFLLVHSACRGGSPVVLDTDGNVRWAGVADVAQYTSEFFDNAVYQANGSQLLRTELDGTVTLLAEFGPLGVTHLDHNFDRGKTCSFSRSIQQNPTNR